MLDVSVVVPARNGWRHLQATLPVLLQEPVREVLVVCNGDTDDTVQQVRAHFPEVVCLELPCGSASAARDYGLRQAKADLVAFRDADDFVVPGGLALQHAALQRDGTLDVVGGQAIWREGMQEVGRSHYWTQPEVVHAACLFQSPLLLGSSMVRRQCGMPPWWGTLYTSGEDWDWLWRLLQRGARMANLAEPVLYYQRHPASLTAGLTPGNQLSDFATVLRMQFLLQSGVVLDAQQMMLFANVAPCAYWSMHEVAWLRTVPNVREATAALLAHVQRHNRGVPAKGLQVVCEAILTEVDRLPWLQPEHRPELAPA